MFVRPYVRRLRRLRPCPDCVTLDLPEISKLWQSIIGRILDSNLIYNIKIRHSSNCDDLVLRTQKVALGPPLPCGCNLVFSYCILYRKYNKDFEKNHERHFQNQISPRTNNNLGSDFFNLKYSMRSIHCNYF